MAHPRWITDNLGSKSLKPEYSELLIWVPCLQIGDHLHREKSTSLVGGEYIY